MSILFGTAFFLKVAQAQHHLEKLPELEGASIGYLVRELETGNVLAQHDASRLLAPASVLKLFTTAAALDQFGSDKTITSSFHRNGDVKNGVLHGDLIFDGNYNPTFLAERYGQSMDVLCEELIAKLKSIGVDTIRGNIKVFDGQSSITSIPRTWIWEDIGNYYGAGFSRTIINENILKLYLKSGKVGSKVEVLRTEPSLPWLTIYSEVFASSVNRDLAYCFSRPGDEEITITGTIPANRNSFLVKASLPDPSYTFAVLLHQALQKKGIIVAGNPLVDRRMDRSQLVHKTASPSMSAMVRKTNQMSLNIYAESLLKMLENEVVRVSGEASWDMKELLGQYFDVKTMKVYDGSGLSRFNAVSAKQVVDLITWMNTHKEQEAFYGSLSIAGESGTLKSLLSGTSAQGRVKGKSGSMVGVRAYAGIINTKKHKNLAFSVMVNNYGISGSQLKKTLEAWLWDLWNKN